MKSWYENFESALKEGSVSRDLIGAGKASSEEAMKHYQFQHRAKRKEAIEDTFPALRKKLGPDWENVLDEFLSSGRASPRNLDWLPGNFCSFFQESLAGSHLKELARFEHHLDIHAWTHKELSHRPELIPDESSVIVLGKHELLRFKAPVSVLYEDGDPESLQTTETVIVWQKESGTYFRSLEDWELSVLEHLEMGLGQALTNAPEDTAAVGSFFEWLGGSCLIQELR